MHYSEVFDLFEKEIPKQLIVEMGKLIISSYRVSHENVNGLIKHPQFKTTLRGWTIRNVIEDGIINLVPNFPGFSTKPQQNDAKTHWYAIIFGPTFSLQQLKVDDRYAPLRHSEITDSCIEGKQQSLFDYHEPVPNPKYHVVFTHGYPSDSPRDVPGYVDIVFPDRRTKTAAKRIRLFETYPELLELVKPSNLTEEKITDTWHPELKAPSSEVTDDKEKRQA